MNFGSLFSMVWNSLLTERAKYRKYRILDLKAKDLIFSPYLAIILGLIPGLGRSPGEGNGNSLQHSCLENPMDGGAWWATVQFSCSVVSDSLWSQGLQHARPPCLSPTLGVYSNSCALNWWCHPTISSSVNLFSSCLQSFPASGLGKVNPHPNFQEMQYQRMVQTTGKLHSSPMLVRLCSKFYTPGFSIMLIENFQMSKLGLEKAEEPEIKLPTFAGL